MPLISIILPVYNGEEFLKETIESVLNQSFHDWELILVNDGSTDFTQEIVQEYAKQDFRIRVISQPNLGLSTARNTGFAHCKGEIIGFLDADDKYLPECLTIISNRFRSFDVDLLISGYFYFQDDVNLHTHKFQNKQIRADLLVRGNIAPPVSHFIRRELANKLGSFDPILKSCEDWDFWIRAGKMGAKIYTVPEVLVGYRYVPKSMSRNPRVMYDALSEVSRRAGAFDSRLPEEASYNQKYDLDFPVIQKNHFVRMLGVMIHQGKVDEAINWYKEEQNKWNWKLEKNDWKNLSTYLSWGYFFEPEEIKQLLQKTKTDLNKFLAGLGSSNLESKEILRMVFEPQLKRRNHQRFGKYFGALLNRFKIY